MNSGETINLTFEMSAGFRCRRCPSPEKDVVHEDHFEACPIDQIMQKTGSAPDEKTLFAIAQKYGLTMDGLESISADGTRRINLVCPNGSSEIVPGTIVVAIRRTSPEEQHFRTLQAMWNSEDPTIKAQVTELELLNAAYAFGDEKLKRTVTPFKTPPQRFEAIEHQRYLLEKIAELTCQY